MYILDSFETITIHTHTHMYTQVPYNTCTSYTLSRSSLSTELSAKPKQANYTGDSPDSNDLKFTMYTVIVQLDDFHRKFVIFLLFFVVRTHIQQWCPPTESEKLQFHSLKS